LYTIALSGLRELHLDVNGIIKIVELEINDNDTVDLPNDFVNYRKIGIVGADGRIHSLGRDDKLSLNADCGLDTRSPLPVDDPNMIPFSGLSSSGSYSRLSNGSGGVFAMGGGNNELGYYRYNRKTNQFWLANLGAGVGCTLVVEYIGDIESDGGDFFVHPYVINTIKRWISMEYAADDRNTDGGEKRRRLKAFHAALRKSKNRYGSSTPEEWAAALRKSNTATVKF
jgi:hypothetical protein